MKSIKLYNIKKVAGWEFVKAAKSPTFLVLTFIVPLIMVLVSGVGILSERMERVKITEVAVMDRTGVFYPYLQAHMGNGTLRLTEYNTERVSEIEALVLEGKYIGFMEFTQENIQNGHITFYAKDFKDVNHNVLVREIGPVLSLYRLQMLGLEPEQIAAVSVPLVVDVRTIAGDELNLVKIILPMVSGIMLIIAVIFSGQVLMYGVIKEKQNRVVEILLSSISSFELLLGKIIGFGLLSLLQMVIWGTVGVTVGVTVARRFIDLRGLEIGVSDIAVPALFFLFGYFMLAALFAAVGATMKEAEGGSQMQGLFIMIPMIPMFLAGPLMMTPNALWVRVLSHIPPFIPTTVLLRMGGTTLPLWEIISTLTALVISAILFVILGAKVFKGGIMQYDRAVNFKDLRAILARED